MPGPDIWGPHGWKFIHYITLGYPDNPTEEDKKTYYNFFILLADVIPCSICATHFKQHLEITPLDDEALKNKESLMTWGIKMHNHVNAKNGKKIYSIKEGINAIIKNDDTLIHNTLDNFSNRNKPSIEKFNNTTSSTILTISIILNLLLILYLLFKLK